MKKVFLLFLILSPIHVFSQVGGEHVFRTLNIPGSAQVAGIGGSYIPVVNNDLELALFNPSILDSSMNNQLSLSYVNYFSDINFGYAAFAKTINKRTYSASVRYMDYGKLKETDITGVEIGNFTSNDMIVSFGTGFRADTNWTIGANLKFIYSNIAAYNSFGAAIDLSATYYNPEKEFTAVWIAKNIGYQLSQYGEGEREKLPFEFQMGLSKKLAHAPFRFSLMYDNIQKWDLTFQDPNEVISIDPITGEQTGKKGFPFGDLVMRHVVVGGEILLTDNFVIRFGYNYRRRQELKLASKSGFSGISFGVGMKINRFKLNYARSSFHQAGPSNHFTIGTTFSEWRK